MRAHELVLRTKEENMYLLSWVIVGLIVGWSAGRFLTAGGYGPILDIAMGIVGAVAGGFLMRISSSSAYAGLLYTSMAAIVGAVLLTGLTGFVNGRKRYA
jgi:uncharacterized membrane protein YeaQ/YmgE (transglycosylase-associated protein family)